MPILEYTPHKHKIRPKETLKAETYKVIRSLIITLAIMVLVLSSIFLGITSKNAQKGYTLKQAKLKNDLLRNENNTLNSKINDSTAFTKLKENKKIDNMTRTEIKNYITKEDNLVK